jgi:hypothetical protein
MWTARCRQHAQNIERYDFSAKESDYEAHVTRAKTALANSKQNLHDEMVQARVEERDLLGALRAFQAQNDLERDAKYPDVPLLAFSLLIALTLVEALLNANIFADVSNWGLLGGAFAALGMSLPNVLGGCLIGLFGVRGALNVNGTIKFLGWVGVILGISLLLFYNFYLAHYRALLSTNKDAEFFATWSRMFADPLGFMVAQQSVILLLLGLIAAGIAVWKGVDGFSDPYLGYARVDGKYRRALKTYESAKIAYRSCVKTTVTKGVQDIDAAVQSVDRKQGRVSNIVRSAILDFKAVEDGMVRSINACRTALNVYRRENMLVRRNAPPAYFSSYPELKAELPELKECEVIALRDRMGAEAARLHKEANAKIADLLGFATAETAAVDAEIKIAEASANERRRANTAQAIKVPVIDTEVALSPA